VRSRGKATGPSLGLLSTIVISAIGLNQKSSDICVDKCQNSLGINLSPEFCTSRRLPYARRSSLTLKNQMLHPAERVI
jgi:hypothetical protein